MDNKKIITGTLIGLGSVIGLGLLYKYYFASPTETKEKVEEKKTKEEPKVEETKVEKEVAEKVQEIKEEPSKIVQEPKKPEPEKKQEEKVVSPKQEEKKEDSDKEESTIDIDMSGSQFQDSDEEDGNGKLTGEINLENSHFKDNSMSNSINNSFVVVDEPPTPSEFKMFVRLSKIPTVESWKVDATAKFLGIKVNYVEVTDEDLDSGFFKEMISPMLQFPTLQTPQGTIWESNAIVRYLSTVGNDRQLYNAFVDNWLVWFENLQKKISVVLNHSLGNKVKPTKPEIKEFDEIINNAFTILNKQLEGVEYICQDMSLADIQGVCLFRKLYETQFDEDFRKKYSKVTSWFKHVASKPEISLVLGEPKFKVSKKNEEGAKGFDMKAYKKNYLSIEVPHDTLTYLWKQNVNLQQGNTCYFVTSKKTDYESKDESLDLIESFTTQFKEESTFAIHYLLNTDEKHHEIVGIYIFEGKQTPDVFKSSDFSKTFTFKRQDWKKNKKDIDNYLSAVYGQKLLGKKVIDKQLNF
eukprot:gene8794-742_t